MFLVLVFFFQKTFFSHVCNGKVVLPQTCSTSNGFFTFCFWSLHPRPVINREVPAMSFAQPDISPLSETYYKTKLPLRIFTKHTVRPQRRCLFVFFTFSYFFQNVLPAPTPLIIRILKQTSNSLMCLKPMENQ